MKQNNKKQESYKILGDILYLNVWGFSNPMVFLYTSINYDRQPNTATGRIWQCYELKETVLVSPTEVSFSDITISQCVRIFQSYGLFVYKYQLWQTA